MKQKIKLYVTLEVDEVFFKDYQNSRDYVYQELQFVAEDFDGKVVDLEIK